MNQPNKDPLEVLVYWHRLSTPARPATPPEPRHKYLTPNAVSNGANTLAGHNVNRAAKPKGKAISMNSTNASGSQNPPDSLLLLPEWSSSSSVVSADFDLHHTRVVSMTSPVDQGGDSTACLIPLSIKPQAMLNKHRMMKELWSPTDDDKSQKCKAQFEVDY